MICFLIQGLGFLNGETELFAEKYCANRKMGFQAWLDCLTSSKNMQKLRKWKTMLIQQFKILLIILRVGRFDISSNGRIRTKF